MELDLDRLKSELECGSIAGVQAAAANLIDVLAEHPNLVALNRHPVGFAHAKLAETDQGAIRLHVWPVPGIEPQHPPWLVHRHAWTLTSYVVRGAVVNQTYTVSANANGPHRLYTVGYEDSVSVMTAVDGPVACSLASSTKIAAGARYPVAASDFHSTVPDSDEPTATIAITSEPSDLPPLVVGTADGDADYRFKRERFAAKVAKCYFRSLQ